MTREEGEGGRGQARASPACLCSMGNLHVEQVGRGFDWRDAGKHVGSEGDARPAEDDSFRTSKQGAGEGHGGSGFSLHNLSEGTGAEPGEGGADPEPCRRAERRQQREG